MPQKVTIAAGKTTAKLQVQTVGDETDEDDSTVTAMVNDGTGYTIGSSNSAEVTVADNDGGTSPTLPPGTPDLPQVTIRASQTRVTEGEAVSFTVTANPAPAAALVVSVTVAETGDTLAAPVPQEVTIARSSTAVLPISTVDDTEIESDSTVTATVNSGTGYTVASPRSASVTVADDDGTTEPPDDSDPPMGGKPTVSITSVSPNAVAERGVVTVSLSASPVPTEQIGGTVFTRDSDDNIGAQSYSFVFASGDRTGSVSFRVSEDGVNGEDRTLRIWLRVPSDSDNYQVSGGEGTVTISDGSD